MNIKGEFIQNAEVPWPVSYNSGDFVIKINEQLQQSNRKNVSGSEFPEIKILLPNQARK